MRTSLALLGLTLAACPLLPTADAGLPADVVRLDTGEVRGVVSGGTRAYRGIPYAEPPVGELRWRAPRPAAAWSGVRDASRYGAICPQGDDGDEDCLTLNVWVPDAGAEPLPVLVYLHGGDNVSGAAAGSSDGDYDGEVLASRASAVVVTVNYRLGPLGFFPHPAFAAENEHGSTGNYGLLDQLLALDWVQRNIGAFGGDASRVMLFGQSAGGYDTCALVTSPLAKGLFHAALMQSGPCWVPRADDRDALVAFVSKEVGCTGAEPAACLRKVSAKALAATVGAASRAAFTESNLTRYKFYPNVDGWVLPVAPLEALKQGTHNAMPLAFGTTADELQTLFGPTLAAAPVNSEALYVEWITAVVRDGALAQRAAARYRPDAYGSYNEALLELMGDVIFHCRVCRAMRAAAASQREPLWRYSYTHVCDDTRLKTQKAGHGMEVPFVWGGHDWPSFTFELSEREVPFSEALSGYWARFGARGNPNAEAPPGSVEWPAWDAATDRHLVLDLPFTVADGVRTDDCDFWDAEGVD